MKTKIKDEWYEYWKEKVISFEEENVKLPESRIVLVGDSLTEQFPVKEMFPGLNIVNRGISGDRIGGWKYYGVLDRLFISVLDLKSQKVFLLIGVNDILKGTPYEEIYQGYNTILHSLKKRKEGINIFVQSLLPVCKDYTIYCEKIKIFNNRLEQLAKKYNVHYIDVHINLCSTKGPLAENFTDDGLHLNIEGYKEWRKVLLPLLTL